MSVILDALQRARRDDHRPAGTTSNAVEVARPTPRIVVEQRGGRLMLTAVILTFIMVWLIAATAVVYWFFYRKPPPVAAAPPSAQQGQVAVPSVSQTAPIAVAQPAPQAPLAIPSAAELPPPVPISSLPSAASASHSPTSSRVEITEQPSAIVPSGDQKLVLGTIMCDAADCFAMINGKSVRRGQTIAGHKVIEVTATEVTLKRGYEAPITLSLTQQ